MGGLLGIVRNRLNLHTRARCFEKSELAKGGIMNFSRMLRVLGALAVCAGSVGIAQAQMLRSIAEFDAANHGAEAELPWIIQLSVPASATSSGGDWESLDSYIDRVQEELVAEMGWRNLNDIIRYTLDAIAFHDRSTFHGCFTRPN